MKDRKEYFIEYNAKNAEKRKAYAKEWREKNKEYHREYQRKWVEENREKWNAYQKEWRAKNKHKLAGRVRTKRTPAVTPKPTIQVPRLTTAWDTIKAKLIAYRNALKGGA